MESSPITFLAPKKGVPKTYFAHIEGIVTEEDLERFAEGVILHDGYLRSPVTTNIKILIISQIELRLPKADSIK